MKKEKQVEPPKKEKDSVGTDLLLLKNRALNVAAEGITIADMRLPDQPLIYINEGFERLTGYSAKSMKGNNCRFLQGKDTDPATIDEIREAIASGNECTVEILNHHKNGEAFWNRLSLTPVRDNSGEVTHFIGVQSDITKRKHAEEALREANRQLEIINRRMKEDLEAAAAIQSSLLPARKPRSKDLRFSWVSQPCEELGGDTFNVFPLDDQRFAVYMVDVSGHGVRASLLSFTLSHWFLRLSQKNSRAVTKEILAARFSPVEVAEELNRQFQMDMENPQYFTMCYGVIDARTREFRFVSAGNPPLAVARGNGTTEVLKIEGFPIGIVEKPEYSEKVIRLDPGDRVFLYTDGLTEAEDKHDNPYGIEKLAEKILANKKYTLEDCVDSIMKSVNARASSRGLEDDVSILAFELAEPSGKKEKT
jgi:PAS domain S-box-containing protein